MSVKRVCPGCPRFVGRWLGVDWIKPWDYTSTVIISSQTLERDIGGQWHQSLARGRQTERFMWVGMEKGRRGKKRGQEIRELYATGNLLPLVNLPLNAKSKRLLAGRIVQKRSLEIFERVYLWILYAAWRCVYVCVCVVDAQPTWCMCACILTDGYCNDAGTNYWVSLCLWG